MNTCSAASDCKATGWCNNGTCEAKKSNGATCQNPDECTSNVCALGYCCNVACADPASCSTGTCSCGGTPCTGTTQCVLFYKDADGDSYGSAADHQAACESSPPAGYVKDNTDCDDQNATAHPGQTTLQSVARANGSFDYNCDGQETRKFPNVYPKTCGLCINKSGTLCGPCYIGFGCNGTCGSVGPFEGFKAEIACGAAAPLYTCNDSDPTVLGCAVGAETQTTATQQCL